MSDSLSNAQIVSKPASFQGPAQPHNILHCRTFLCFKEQLVGSPIGALNILFPGELLWSALTFSHDHLRASLGQYQEFEV